jgi:hypothetical protein
VPGHRQAAPRLPHRCGDERHARGQGRGDGGRKLQGGGAAGRSGRDRHQTGDATRATRAGALARAATVLPRVPCSLLCRREVRHDAVNACPLRRSSVMDSNVQALEAAARTPDPAWHVNLRARDVIDEAAWAEVHTLSPPPRVDIQQTTSRYLLADAPLAGSTPPAAGATATTRQPTSRYWLYAFQVVAASDTPQEHKEQPTVGILVKTELPELDPMEVFPELQPTAARAGQPVSTCAQCHVVCLGSIDLARGALLKRHP